MVPKTYEESSTDQSSGNLRSVCQQRNRQELQMLHGNHKEKYKKNYRVIKR